MVKNRLDEDDVHVVAINLRIFLEDSFNSNFTAAWIPALALASEVSDPVNRTIRPKTNPRYEHLPPRVSSITAGYDIG